MDDRELLELAAKAAGLIAVDGVYLIARDSSGEPHEWNPLTDDGDALRLAVKLGISFYEGNNEGAATFAGYYLHTSKQPNRERFCIENHGNDPCAAARLAIVRAAAAIGKEQSNES